MTVNEQAAHHTSLRLPQQDLDSCSLFACEEAGVAQWVEQLPLGSPHRAGLELRTALSELSRVKLPPLRRFRLLELLREPGHSVVTTLTKACLNQPIVLDDDIQLQAELIADLHELSAAAYTLTAVETIRDKDSVRETNPAKLACESLHRATVFSGQRILLAYLLYQLVEPDSWASLHKLYALSERQQLAQLPVDDELRGFRSSIAQEYLAPLLLACAKPNQLRQNDITGAYRAFQEWREFAELQDPDLGDGLFAVDMQSDRPPAFAELLVRKGTRLFRFINTKPLIAHLEELKRTRGTLGVHIIEFDKDTRLDTNLLEHLIRSLGEISQRNFTRSQSRSSLFIAAGLSNVHFYVAGELSLEQVYHGSGYRPTGDTYEQGNPFMAAATKDDGWEERHASDSDSPAKQAENAVGVDVDRITRAALAQQELSRKPVRHIVNSVKTTNTSPGGYCVEWEEPPEGIHIGDLVCVRDAKVDEAEWTIAVIRWVSRVKNSPTLLGLELISPRGAAYSAQIKMPSGEYSKPIRVILLPEIPLVGKPHTLVVPRMVFKEGQRITLTRAEDAFLVKLKRQVSSTGYFSRLDFDYLRQLDDDGDNTREKLPTAAFESIWSEI
ncbi:MAG: GTPase [Congregibacter sp.]